MACTETPSKDAGDPQDTDTGETGEEESEFQEELVLATLTGDFGAPAWDCQSYRPLHQSLASIQVVGLTPPEAPYEIRGLSASSTSFADGVDDGVDCASTNSMELFVYLGEEAPQELNEAGSMPPVPRTASLVLTGTVEVDPSRVRYEVLSGTLDEPVRVESGEMLWLGAAQVTDPSASSASCTRMCEAPDRFSEEVGESWTFGWPNDWTQEVGAWTEDNDPVSLPMLSVTLGI